MAMFYKYDRNTRRYSGVEDGDSLPAYSALEAPNLESDVYDTIQKCWCPAPVIEQDQSAADRQRIRSRLSEIDAFSVRGAREITIAVTNGDPIPEYQKQKLIDLEAEAITLRAELAGLS